MSWKLWAANAFSSPGRSVYEASLDHGREDSRGSGHGIGRRRVSLGAAYAAAAGPTRSPFELEPREAHGVRALLSVADATGITRDLGASCSDARGRALCDRRHPRRAGADGVSTSMP